MRHNKPLQILWIVALIIAASTSRSLAQLGARWNPGFAINTSSGNLYFNETQTPDQLVISRAAAISVIGGVGYQWQQSSVPMVSGFTAISGATSTSYSIPAPLTQDIWYRLEAYSISNPSYA